MAKKLYAVKNGRANGIFKSWDECKEQVDGYSGAVYKSFVSLNDANEYLGIAEVTESYEVNVSSDSLAMAYVDGSYDDKTKHYSYGMIIFHDQIEERFAEKYSDPLLVGMRNVAGEIIGAQKAMQFCLDNDISSLELCYDYEGIEKWCTGEWKAKKEGTKAYKEFYNEISDILSVKFVKIVGHSGDKYNDIADELAKSALGISKVSDITHCSNGMTASNIEFDELEAIIEMIKVDIPDLIIEKCNNPHGQGFNLKILKPHKQKLKVIHFNDKNKILIQGKKEELFNFLSMYVVELLEVEEVPEFLNSIHNLEVKKDLIDSEFESMFPNAKGKLPEKINNYLHQAVYNLNISGEVYNATFLVEPAIRPLEAILKIALQENDIPIRKEGLNYDSFFVFSRKKASFILSKDYVKPNHKDGFITYIGKCYSHFNKNRHTLSHWDNPLEILDTTRIIKTVDEAHLLIRDTIQIIDNYYSL